RDVRAIVPFLAQVFLFLTPVAYPTSLVPDRWLIIYGLNPMASVVEGFRSALLGSEPPPARMLAASVIAAIALLGAALSYFHRVDRVFADVICADMSVVAGGPEGISKCFGLGAAVQGRLTE